MSVQPSAQVADLDAVRQSLAQICGSCDDFDRFFSGVFARLEDLAGELVRRQQTWTSQRKETESELSRRKTELGEALREVDRRRSEIETSETAGEVCPADDELKAEIRRLQQERDELRQQQRLLEVELDTVRNRAAEMAEQLAQQQGQILTERAEWNEELKRMRRVIESFTLHYAERSSGQPQPAAPGEPPSAQAGEQEPPRSADPVLGSVVAQFEMLQKDVAGRRKKVAGTRG